MSIDLMKLPAPEAERLAYAEGFTQTAALFARIADLQKALGQTVAENENLRADLYAAKHDRAYRGADD
jgi:hypothetical protein